MTAGKVKPGIYWVGALDWDRRLFDELVATPDGTSYNSYLIKGSEKTALIDTVDPSKEHILINHLRSLNIDAIDYIIANHAEQDHSGTLSKVLSLYPDAKIVTSSKCAGLLKELLLIDEGQFIEINDGDSLSLGDKTLEFIFAPWVHWPETMFTYIKEDGILFTCDFLGAHIATSDLFVKDQMKVGLSAKRYYAEIMMPFRTNIKKHLEKLGELRLEIIAPSHGPLYDEPEPIIDAYKDWVADEVKNEVVIAYISMHGSTQKMVDFLEDALIEKGISVKHFNLSKTDIGEFAMALVDAATLIMATPTVLAGAHPSAVYAAYLANALRPKLKHVCVIGSYGWGGKTVEQLTGMMSNLKAEFIDPVYIKGQPKPQDFESLSHLANEIHNKHSLMSQ